MTTQSDRERVARIIDPENWEAFDAAMASGERMGAVLAAAMRRDWEYEPNNRSPSLAKADAILALTPRVPGDVVERLTAVLHDKFGVQMGFTERAVWFPVARAAVSFINAPSSDLRSDTPAVRVEAAEGVQDQAPRAEGLSEENAAQFESIFGVGSIRGDHTCKSWSDLNRLLNAAREQGRLSAPHPHDAGGKG